MRLEVCGQIWHGFGVLHRHLLLMMDFDCPLTFRHKKGEYTYETYEMFLAHFVLVFVLGGEFTFDWLELVELFRLYLGASLCTLPFLALATLFLPCLGYSC